MECLLLLPQRVGKQNIYASQPSPLKRTHIYVIKQEQVVVEGPLSLQVEELNVKLCSYVHTHYVLQQHLMWQISVSCICPCCIICCEDCSLAVGPPQVYDWRQYKTDDGGSTPHVQSVEARLASLLNAQGQVPSPCGEPQQDPSTSDSVEHDNSLANTLVGWTHARRYACACTCMCSTAVETGTLGLKSPAHRRCTFGEQSHNFW